MPKGGTRGLRKLEKVEPGGTKNYGVLATHDLEAFEVFFQTRHYNPVAKQFHVSHTAVIHHAEKHNWLDRLATRLQKIENKVTEKLSDRLARDSARHYDIMGLVQANAVNILKRPDLAHGGSLKPHELISTAAAVEVSVKTQRLVAGESTDKHEVSFKDLIQAVFKRMEALNQRPAVEGPGGRGTDGSGAGTGPT